jgi:hypothetical protein
MRDMMGIVKLSASLKARTRRIRGCPVSAKEKLQ